MRNGNQATQAPVDVQAQHYKLDRSRYLHGLTHQCLSQKPKLMPDFCHNNYTDHPALIFVNPSIFHHRMFHSFDISCADYQGTALTHL